MRSIDQDLNTSAPAWVDFTMRPPYGRRMVQGALALSLIGLVVLGGGAIRRRRERDEAREQLLHEQEEELQSAREMQMALMPTTSPGGSGLEIAGVCRTANHVGGDLFQYFTGDDKISMASADVTGKAMEAAIPVVMHGLG